MEIYNQNNASLLSTQLSNPRKLLEAMELWDAKKGDWIKLIPWPYQDKLLWALHFYKKIIILKKRQLGGTQIVMADSLCQAMGRLNFSTLFLSVGQFEANQALLRGRGMLERLPEPIRVAADCRPTATELAIKATGSKILSLTAHNGRSLTASRVVIDEGAYITPTEAHISLDEVLANVCPALDRADGQLVIISTANGTNDYHDIWSQAIDGKNGYLAIFVSCWDDPDFTEAKRVEIERDHGTDHVMQEYPRTWEEAFLSSGRPRFDRKAIEAVPILATMADKEIQALHPDIEVYQSYNEYGDYAVFADVAEGGEQGDYSVAKVFNRATQQQVACWRGHCEPKVFGGIIVDMARYYNGAVITVERNNHGHAVLLSIVDIHKYATDRILEALKVGISNSTDVEIRNPVTKYGWETNRATKPMIIDGLAYRILKGEVPGISDIDKRELDKYVIKKDGKTGADGSFHDDCVMTLAIAYYLMGNESFNMSYPFENLVPRPKKTILQLDMERRQQAARDAEAMDEGEALSYDDIAEAMEELY